MSALTTKETKVLAIRGRAADVFADPAVAEEWLNTPNSLLSSSTPLEAVASGDWQYVDEILTRIEYGIFS